MKIPGTWTFLLTVALAVAILTTPSQASECTTIDYNEMLAKPEIQTAKFYCSGGNTSTPEGVKEKCTRPHCAEALEVSIALYPDCTYDGKPLVDEVKELVAKCKTILLTTPTRAPTSAPTEPPTTAPVATMATPATATDATATTTTTPVPVPTGASAGSIAMTGAAAVATAVAAIVFI